MAALFSGPKKPDNSAQIAMQKQQDRRIREQEIEEGTETGARNRILNARLQSRGVPQLVNQRAGAGNTLAG